MCRANGGGGGAPARRRRRRSDDVAAARRFLRCFFGLALADATICLTIAAWAPADPTERRYRLHSSVWDVAVCYGLRTLAAVAAAFRGYSRHDQPQDDSDAYHENGDRKSRAELADAALEVPYATAFRRHVLRPAFACEFAVLLTSSWLAVKCLSRLDFELEHFQRDHPAPTHPLFWTVLAVSAAFGWLQGGMVQSAVDSARACGKAAAQSTQTENDNDNDITEPLLMASNESATDLSAVTDDSEQPTVSTRPTTEEKDEVRAYSGIGADPNYKASLSDLMEFCAPDKCLIIISIAFLFAAAAANVYIPHITGQILDVLVSNTGDFVHSTEFRDQILLLAGVSVMAGVFSGCRAAIFTIIGARVNVRLRIRLLDSLLMQELGFFDTTRTGDISSRLGSDTTLVGSSVTSSVNVFLQSSARAIGTLTFMCYLSWQLSLLALLTIPSTATLSKWYGQYVRKMSKLQQKKLADGNSVSDATISSMATVKAFGAELLEMSEFKRCMDVYLKLNRRAALATWGYGACVGALPQLAKALVLYYGGLLVQTEQLTGGQLVTFILYLSALAESFNSLAGIYASLTRAIGGADKVFELMQRKPQFKQPTAETDVVAEQNVQEDGDTEESQLKITQFRHRGVSPEACQGRITLENVKLCYPARPQRTVLDGLSLTFPPGAVVALVGPSGSGKSSVVSLVQHLYEPEHGTVAIDDVPVHDLSHDWLTRHVSVVSQEPTLFARSIKQNIMYGLEGTPHEPTMEEVEEAARLANADSFIQQLPMGYDTSVGERGIQLSGGQKQRVAIARALVRKPRILLLDEATSALDSVSEHAVQSAIDEMIKSRRQMTVVIVAHRLSTIRNADMICVIEEGVLVEQGTHAELTSNPNGAYSALVQRQLQIHSAPPETGKQEA